MIIYVLAQNFALARPAYQASDYEHPNSSSVAVDGDSNTDTDSCTHIPFDSIGPWFVIALETVYNISRILITYGNNTGRCTSYKYMS